MNRRTPFTISIIILIAILILTACGGDAGQNSEPAAADVQEVQAEPAATPEETAVANTEDEAEMEEEPETASEPGTDSGGFQTFVIDSGRSQASYIATEELFEEALTKYNLNPGFNEVTGVTSGVEGQIQLNLDDLSAPIGESEFVVDLSQLKTDQTFRDRWLQDNGPRFRTFPEAIFTITGVSGLPDTISDGQSVNFQMSGDLTVRNESQPVTFDVTATLSGDTISGEAEGSDLLMSDFGIEPPNFANTLSVDDAFSILVEFTAVSQ